MIAKKQKWLILSLIAVAGLTTGFVVDRDILGEKTGGDTTVFVDGRNAFSFPLANLADEERTRFVIGNSFFKRNWVEAPASTGVRDGLGPHFIARSCAGCHTDDGRGAPPEMKLIGGKYEAKTPIALLMRLSVPGVGAHGEPLPDPNYGGQFNNAAVTGVKPEGDVKISYQPIHGKFADGRPYTLLKPNYSFINLNYGAFAKETMVSPRIAPQMIGVGLIEAIAERDIEKNAQDQALRSDAIKGVPNRVWDAFANKTMIGRFGWKANVATLAHQTAGAFLGDIGITSEKNPREDCMPSQKDCLTAPSGKSGKEGVEIDNETLANVIFYQATLAPPARRNPTDPAVLRGQKIFEQGQCLVCHRAHYQTDKGPFPNLTSNAVNQQDIWPYTDLLLHDMGEGLADHRPDFLANGRQWKTPPLWGIGLIRDVNGHTRLLHDGRARNVLEAILWHSGEAEQSKQFVLKLKKSDVDALVKFVESL